MTLQSIHAIHPIQPMGSSLNLTRHCPAGVIALMEAGSWTEPDVSKTLAALKEGLSFDPVEWRTEKTDLLVIMTRLTIPYTSLKPINWDRSTGIRYMRDLIRSGFLQNDRDGRTSALHVAARHLLLKPLFELLAGGADPLILDPDGKTAVQLLESVHGALPGEVNEPPVSTIQMALKSAMARRVAHAAMVEIGRKPGF